MEIQKLCFLLLFISPLFIGNFRLFLVNVFHLFYCCFSSSFVQFGFCFYFHLALEDEIFTYNLIIKFHLCLIIMCNYCFIVQYRKLKANDNNNNKFTVGWLHPNASNFQLLYNMPRSTNSIDMKKFPKSMQDGTRKVVFIFSVLGNYV